MRARPAPATARTRWTSWPRSSDDEMLDQPYVPINVAALTEAGIVRRNHRAAAAGATTSCAPPASSRTAARGSTPPPRSRRATPPTWPRGCRWPVRPRPWSATTTWPRAGLSNYTFAQPFTLDLGARLDRPGRRRPTPRLSTRFTATPGNPVLGAEQLLAGLSFVHFENAFLTAATRRRRGPAAGLAALGRLHGRAARRARRQPALKAGDPQPALRPGARRRQPRARRAPAAVRARPATASPPAPPTASRSTASSCPRSARPSPGTRPT